MKLKYIYRCILIVLLTGCHTEPVIHPVGDVNRMSVNLPDYVHLEHLVQIKYQDKSFILHGFFIKEKNDFWIKAFGDFDVSLFALRCKENRITYQVDFKRLIENGLNVKRIGEDVWKVYYARSTKELQAFKRINHDLLEEKLELIYYNNKLLKAKCLYGTNNKLITRITYKKYLTINTVVLPKEILLENLFYRYTIKIITLNSIKNYRLKKGLFHE